MRPYFSSVNVIVISGTNVTLFFQREYELILFSSMNVALFSIVNVIVISCVNVTLFFQCDCNHNLQHECDLIFPA